MDSQKLLLTHYINDSNKDLDKLKETLLNLGIYSKDYSEENLLLLYNKYETRNKAALELECRSVIIDRTTFDIVCYSCPTPIYNMEAVNYMIRNSSSEKEIYLCYEGSLLSLFNYNDTWYLSSRRCLNSQNSIMDNKSHYDMFMDVIQQDGYEKLDDFTKFLDKSVNYHFVLIHHENRNVINYEEKLGAEYKKLCFIFARNKVNQTEINSEDIDTPIVSDNIFLPQKLEDESGFDKINKLCDMTKSPSEEGIIIKMNGNYLKLQTVPYQFYKSIGPEKNLFRGFLKLYQSNKLMDYFKNNQNAEKYKKIVNPLNLNESFDTIGTIDALFKVCTSELYHLFTILWDDSGNHLNSEVYNLLPKEYKDCLFHLRGIYFSNKKKYGDKFESYLRIKNVYHYLKSIEIRELENFLRCRKLMFNWLRLDSSNKVLKDFSKSLYKNDKVCYKLTAIYSNKLFPEIMPDDIPVTN